LFEHWLGPSDTTAGWSGSTNYRWQHYTNSFVCTAASGVNHCYPMVYGQACSEFGDPNYYGGAGAAYVKYIAGYYQPGFACANALFGNAGSFAANYLGGKYHAHATVVPGTTGGGPNCYPASCAGQTVRVIWLADSEVNATMGLDVPPTVYTGQAHAYSYTGPSSRPSPDLSAARTAITAAGVAMENAINAALDPADWAAPAADYDPESNTGDPGGQIWDMPDCAGLGVDACEAVITSASALSGKTLSFSLMTAEVADPTVARDLVLSTSPAVGTLVLMQSRSPRIEPTVPRRAASPPQRIRTGLLKGARCWRRPG
jgi:hypothetical protein